ncbi:MAG TPA: CARDB domain-containing protein [Tepidisphaeraceae bacterium]|nr:CARDB domain-containing protein [Tepidisphaeraceae bacterium]
MEPLESRILLSITNAWKAAVSGDFDNPTMWSLGYVPTSTEDAVINVAGSYSVTHNTSATDSINSLLSTQAFSLSAGSLSVSSTVEVDNTFTLSGGTLAGATVLPGSGGQGLTATSGTLNGVTLNGSLAVSGNLGVTVLGGLTLNGTTTLGDSTNGSGGYLSFTGNQTLAGTGSVVFGSASSFNALVATATVTNPNPVLTIGSGITVGGQRGFLGYDTTSGIGPTTSVINNGAIQWSGGTNINVLNTLTNNGTITVSSTGVFSIGGTLKGGTLTTQTGAQISGGTLDGVTISGDFSVVGNSGVTILESLTLDGTATLGTPGAGGYLSFTGSQTLAGTGSVVFGSTSSFNSLVASGTNSVLTIGSGITVSGQTGYLGYDPVTGIGPTTSVINDGTIQWSTGTSINVPNTLTNNGTITVSSTGVFSIGGTLKGGTLTTHTGAQIGGGTLDGVTISGDFFVAGNTGVTILDSLTLDGTATLGSSGNGGYLSFTGSQTLAGTGAVVFGSASSFNALVASGTNAVLTIGSGITVSGQTGSLGYDTTTGIGPTTTVINDGTIQWSTGTNISVPNTLTNDGTITVSSTAVFSIGGTLKSGTLTTQTGAQISGGVLDGVTISGSFGLSGNNSITILDGLTLDGTATLGISGNGGYLVFSGSQTLGGTGSVVFGTASSFNSLVATGTNPVLTIGSGITISGQTGSLGYNPTLGLGTSASIINEGTIQASVMGGTITINTPNNTSNNLGSIIASNGTLALGVPTTLTNNGAITVSSTGVFSVGGTLKGGTLTTQTGAQISGGTLDGVTISGSFGLSGNNSITILDGLTLDGTATLGISGNGGYLVFSGSQTLGGTGSVVFGSASSFNSLAASGTNPVLTIGSGITVSGQTGSLGYDTTTGIGSTASIINQGTIQANVGGGTITVNTPGNTFDNLGSVIASSGTLALSPGGSGFVNDASVTAGPTGAINLTGNFTQSSTGNFNVVLGGATLGLYGHMAVSGTAVLNGGLNITEANGFTPGTGNVFKVLTFTSESGQFANYNGLTLPADTALQPGYDPTDVTLTTVTSTTIAPDLRVTGLTLTPSNPQSGQQITLNWNDLNAGNGATPGSWTDHIVVVNTTTAQTIATLDVPYDAATSGSIPAGGTASRSTSFRLPDGTPGTGNLQVSVTVDYFNTIPEFYPGNVGESNNTTAITTASTLAVYPDLVVTGLTVAPGSPQSGQNITISWNDSNTGSGPTGGNWNDGITVVNTTTGQTLISTSVQYSAAANGNIAAGSSSPQSFMFQLPNGPAGVGQLAVTVTANVGNTLFEYNGSGTATTNNSTSVNVTSTLAAYADLAVSNVTAPALTPPGQQITVGWTLNNIGDSTATGPWTEQVFLATDAAGDNPVLVAAVSYAGPLPANQQISRSAVVQVPAFVSPGNYWFVIDENPYNQVFETNTSNNSAVAASPSTIPIALTLSLASHSVTNAAGPNATTATVSRNGATASPLVVNIGNSDPNDVTVPATVTIPAGQSSVTFAVGVINPGAVQGQKQANLTASAGGVVSGSDTLTVTDSAVATLVLSLSGHTLDENASNPAATGTVTRNTSTAGALVVTLFSNATNKLQVPATVTIPAGQASATFDVTVINDQQIDGDSTATISASAAGFVGGSDSATVLDVNLPSMTLSLADHTVSEDGGVMATIGTITLAAPATTTVVIGLSSSDTSAATVVVPQVIINAGQTSAVFAISAVDDGLDLGDKTTTITAQFITIEGKFVANTAVSDSLTVVEHDGAALSISLPSAAVGQGGTVLATVSRNTDTAAPLTVMLSSTDITHATVPVSVVIPAGQASANFAITGVNDNLPDGEQFASIVASASGFENAITRIGVTSVNLPDLVVTNVNAPASADAGSTAQISFTIVNNGLYLAGGPWNDQIYLDPTDGATGGGLIDTISFNADLAAGGSYFQTQTITLPTAPGHYSVRIVADSGQNVQELSFNNNALSSAQLLDVTAPYNASVFTTLTGPVANGTPIALSGHASLRGTNLPAANVPVAVYVTSAGLVRTLTATTDGNGNYSTTFLPFPLETGTYSISAGYPGAPVGASQGQFTIVGITANPLHDSLRVQVGTPLDGQITLTNLGTTDLSGITAVAQGGPAALNVQLNVASMLPGSGQATLSYTFSAANGGGTTGTVLLHITSAEGAVLDIPINVTLVATTPQLVLDPTYLNAGMLVGQQTLVSFQVTNNGGAASGDVQVLLPGASYLSLASAATIPSLAPGQSATVTLALSPAANLTLGQYTGTLALNYAGTGLSIPYTFTAISSAVGDVQIIVDDIFTFNASGAPRVAGASVSLLDPYDNSHVIATGSSNSDGLATIAAVPAGQYVLQVSAPDHDTYHASLTVVPGITNVGEVFLLNQLVTYNWQVTPTTISDQYSVKLQTSFLTEVPAPVVTITGPDQIPTLQPGQSAQMDIVLTNHGLIAAQGLSITLPTDPEYTFTAPTTVLGTLPAMSSVTVPVMVSRAPSGAIPNAVQGAAPAAASGGATPATDNSSSPCTVYIPATYFVICGGIRHELTPALLPIGIADRACNALGIVAGFLANLFGGGGGFPYFPIILPPIYIPPGPPGTVLPPDKQPPQFPIDDIPNPPAVENPSNCDPVAELAGALAAKALAEPIVGPINDLFNGLNLLNGLLSGHPSTNPLDYANALAAGVGGPAGDLFGNLSGMGQTLNESGYPVPGFGPAEEGAAAPLDVNSSELHAALSDAYTSTLHIQDLLQPDVYFFGSADWVQTSQSATAAQWVGSFLAKTGDTADGSISATDRAQLLALTLPDTVTVADANAFLDRWNRTVAYADQGIFTTAQVPAGQSTDFIDESNLASLASQASDALLASQGDGYTDPVAELHAQLAQFINTINDNSVCASIKLEIDQTATLTRSAFNGTLQITNHETSGPLSNIQLDIHVTDANGNPVNGKFFVSSPTLGGQLTAVDGTGSIPVGGSGSVSYVFIPTEDAAPTAPSLYFIGGTFSYLDPDSGSEVVTPIYPSAITVYPQAKLQLNYFLQKDVIGDDPSTPDVEPSEPAVLGVLVKNIGGGTAQQMSITTAQPQIVENEKGLLANFQIIGTQVGTQAVSPSLTVNFGDIDPGQVGDATFLLLSSLQGEFQDFSATFTHSDALGGLDTSLIDSVQTHELTHAGDFVFPGSTGETSYLVNDVPDPLSMPDGVYLSNGSTAPVNAATNIAVSGSVSSLSAGVHVTATVSSGWTYLQLPDPGAGFVLNKVVRSDGTILPVSDMAWTTDRTIASTGKAVVDNELHILDLNSTGSYTVFYRPVNATAPAVASLQPITSPQTGAINSVDVTFNEPIDPATFDWHNVTLSLNGGSNLITSAVSITQDSTTTFTINGLTPLTGSAGNYSMTVSAVGVSDFFGDAGAGSLSQTWATGTGVPVVVSVGAGDPALRNAAVGSVTVVLSEPIVPSSFDYHALTLTRDGGSNLITSAVTVTRVDDTTYTIGGLSGLTTGDGTYVLSVNAGNLVDAMGHGGVGALSEQWVTSTVSPTIATLQQASQSPRSIVVATLDVTFSEPIDPATFTWQAINYSKQGGPNLIDSSVTIKQLSPTKFEIGNFNHLIAPVDGDYTFTVSAAAVRDLYGNLGTGTASAAWTLDTTAPAAPTGLAISPDDGASPNDSVTDTGNITLTGSVLEPGLRVEVYDGLSTKLADAVVTGTTFSAALTLGPGVHALRVYAVDPAANISASTTLNVQIDATPLSATFAPIVPTGSQPVAFAQLTFTKALDPTTFDYHSLTLSMNGGPNLLDGSVTIQHLSGNTYEIDGLASLSSAIGQYQLSLNPNTVKDLAGDTTTAPISVSWQIAPPIQTASFSNLSASRSIFFGIPSTIFSGKIAGATTLPAAGEMVGITVNGVTIQAIVNAQGNFAASFKTASLPASATPYAVAYAYAGDANLASATEGATTTLTVNPSNPIVTLTAPSGVLTYDGSADVTNGFVSALAGFVGAPAPTGSATLVFYPGTTPTGTPLASPPVNAGTYTAVAIYGGDNNYTSAQSGPVTFVINRANAVIHVIGYDVNSDGSSHTALGTATGVKGENLAADFDLSGTVHTAPGTYTDNWSFTDPAGNYNDASGTVTDTITSNVAVTPSVSVSDPGGTYNGNAFAVTAASVTDPNSAQQIAAFGDPTLSYSYYLNTGTVQSPVWSLLPGAPINAGNYEVIAHYSSNNASYTSADSAADLFTIARADAMIVVHGYSGNYDESAHGATGTATGVLGEDLGTLLHLGNSFTDFPGGTADWTFDGSTNYNPAAGSVQIVIAKADAQIMVNAYSVGYDGNSHTAGGSATGALGENLTGLLNLGGTTHTHAGPYTGDAWSFLGSLDYNSASGTVNDNIAQASAIFSFGGASGTYDGNSHAATGSAAGVESPNPQNLTGLLHFSYKNLADNSFSSSAPVHAGNYELFYSFDGNTDYAAVSLTDATALVSIAPKTLTASIIGDPTKPYDGGIGATLGSSNFQIFGLIGTENFTVTQPTGTFNSSHVLAANLVTASLSPGNFTPASGVLPGDYAFPITASGPGHIGTAAFNYQIANDVQTYGHAANLSADLGASIATGVHGESLGILYNSVGDTDTAHAGGYPITGAPHDGTGLLSDYAVTLTPGMLTVNKADATINVQGYDVPSDGNPHTATGSATGVFNEGLVGLDLTGTTHTTPGTYTDTWTFIDSTGNYNNASGTVTDIIIGASSAMLAVNPASGTYGGTSTLSATLTANGVAVSGEMVSFSFDNGLHVIGTVMTNGQGVATLPNINLQNPTTGALIAAGSYAAGVFASFAGDSNYSANSGAGALTVNKASFTYQIGSDSHVFGSTANLAADLGTSINTGINNETLNIAYSSTGNSATATVATYAITGVLSDGTGGLLANYNVTLKNGTLSVTKAGTTTALAGPGTITYGGATVAFSANVAAVSPSVATVNEGTVTFTLARGNTTLQTISGVAVSNGIAAATFNLGASFIAGGYTVTATYMPKSAAPQFTGSSLSQSLTITPAAASAVYVGPTFVSAPHGANTASVKLQATVTDPRGNSPNYSVANALVNFYDMSSGTPVVLAANVPVVLANRRDSSTGTATATVMLGTGGFVAQGHLIRAVIVGSYAGTNDPQPVGDKTVAVAQPTAPNTLLGAGSITYLPSAAGSLIAPNSTVSYTFGLSFGQSGTTGTNPVGDIEIFIQQPNGGPTYVIRSTSISSLKFSGTQNKKGMYPIATFVANNASIYQIDSSGGETLVASQLSIQVSAQDGKIARTDDYIAFTILSTTNALEYSNNWNPNSLKTLLEDIGLAKTNSVVIN